ncbi:hypothetical protein RND71_015680 [Anisodus tanguticus]|uniref:Uncharacterized protein n=1 Tax=Anisodus tanguticus TaxID=243964 RepID=A0AAE1S7J8_9SOLA|nr:hypothetical protein RND71_015680 [Anisodus tanguticus]
MSFPSIPIELRIFKSSIHEKNDVSRNLAWCAAHPSGLRPLILHLYGKSPINFTSLRMLIKLAFEASLYESENINTEEKDHEEASSYSSFMNVKGIFKWGAAPEIFERE